MSDAELSDIADDDDIVRRYEEDNDENEDGAIDQDGNESIGEVKADGDDENADAQRVEPPKKKKLTRKVFVLNSERLKGRKGVHTIEKLYEGFKFQGKGHEKEDLDKVMKRLEYWAFRIFPKLDFDDFLAKCEHLGHKKDMHVHLKKYRMGLITANDVMELTSDIIEEEEENEDDSAIGRRKNELLAQTTNDDFQRLFDETEQAAEAI